MEDSGSLRTRHPRLRSLLQPYVERDEIPGLVAIVHRRGETLLEPIGTLAMDHEVPVRRDTIFRISSMTKPITAAATMLLLENGELRLDDPVDRWLPELADRRVLKHLDGPIEETVPVVRPITVRDLLSFRMGFGIPMVMPGTYPIQRAADDLRLGQGPPTPSVPRPPDEWMTALGTLPLMYQPGERWMYSTGADVLGVLIARVSGRPFESFLREHLFGPLGMVDTGFSVPASKVDRFATLYAPDAATGTLVVRDPARGGEWNRPPHFPSGAAGLVSTADDYLAFAKMLLAGGRHDGTLVLAPASVEAMTTDQLTPAQKALSEAPGDFFATHGWGYGVAVNTGGDDPAQPVGSYGWNGGLGTIWGNDPRGEVVAILLTQRMWDSPIPPPVAFDFLKWARAPSPP
jgi:CubicO group peptidase (beta-lactamase class C family)